MGIEPRAAERLRLAVASAGGKLDDIAHLIATPSEGGAPEERDPGPPGPHAEPPHDPLHRSAA